MDIIALFKTVGQIAGIGGIALVALLLLYRDIISQRIFPQLTKEQSYRLIRLIAILVFLIALSGLGGWVWIEMRPAPPPPNPTPISTTGIGGVAAGNDVNVGKIDIHHTDTSTPPIVTLPAEGVTTKGGVAAGGNVTAEEIKINAH